MTVPEKQLSGITPNPLFLKRMNNRWLTGLFIAFKIPLAWIAGLRVDQVDPESCSVSLPYGWKNQNPFKSIYFAALAMAAEMSTGMLGGLACESVPESIAMLVVNMEGDFIKKANRRITFISHDGPAFFAAIAETVKTGEPVTVKSVSEGVTADGTVVARFTFTWSFKKRSRS